MVRPEDGINLRSIYFNSLAFPLFHDTVSSQIARPGHREHAKMGPQNVLLDPPSWKAQSTVQEERLTDFLLIYLFSIQTGYRRVPCSMESGNHVA
jgi:hypothetical protein